MDGRTEWNGTEWNGTDGTERNGTERNGTDGRTDGRTDGLTDTDTQTDATKTRRLCLVGGCPVQCHWSSQEAISHAGLRIPPIGGQTARAHAEAMPGMPARLKQKAASGAQELASDNRVASVGNTPPSSFRWPLRRRTGYPQTISACFPSLHRGYRTKGPHAGMDINRLNQLDSEAALPRLLPKCLDLWLAPGGSHTHIQPNLAGFCIKYVYIGCVHGSSWAGPTLGSGPPAQFGHDILGCFQFNVHRCPAASHVMCQVTDGILPLHSHVSAALPCMRPLGVEQSPT